MIPWTEYNILHILNNMFVPLDLTLNFVTSNNTSSIN